MAFFSSRRPHHGPMSRSDFAKLPRHVAIIMDGNGRWAKKHKLAVAMGHRQGVEALREIIRHTDDLGCPCTPSPRKTGTAPPRRYRR